MNKSQISRLLNKTWNTISDICGSSVPYSESMDFSLFDMLVHPKKSDFDMLRSISRNSRFHSVPSFASYSFEEAVDYINEHQEEIFEEIQDTCEEYLEEYAA